MAKKPETVERRREDRASCAHLAEIRVGSHVVVHALVKDLSDRGARLQIPENSWLPGSFNLSVPGLGLNRRATCRWRRRDFAGLEFDPADR
jgi:hypothetical protein